MAEAKVTLKLESKEYDDRLKRAAEGLSTLLKEIRDGSAASLDGIDAATEGTATKFAKEFGIMNTVAKTTSGQLREMEKAYKDLAGAYNMMSDSEKSMPFGQALGESLEQLKQRTMAVREAMNEATRSLNGTNDSLNETAPAANDSSGILGMLAEKFTINIDAISLFNSGLSVAKGALGVVKDAMFQNESVIDAWGSVVESAKGTYDIFLQTLNNGNWSNFFANLDSAICGSLELYNALDRLGSVKANNAAAIAIQQQQIQQLRLMKQQGQNVDAQLKQATERLAYLQNQAVVSGKTAGFTAIGNTIRNGYQSHSGAKALSGTTINAVVKDLATNGQDAFDKYKKILDDLTKSATTIRNYGTSRVRTFDINLLSDEQKKQYMLAKTITERETEIQKGLEIYAQATKEGASNAREEFKGNRYAKQSASSKSAKDEVTYADDSIMAQEKLVSDLTEKWKTAAASVRDGYARELEEAKKRLEEMTGKSTAVENFQNQFSTTAEGIGDGRSSYEILQDSIRAEISEKNIAVDEQAIHDLMKVSIENGLQGLELDFTSLQEQMREGLDISDEAWQELTDKINEQLAELGIEPIVFDVDTKKIETAAQQQQKSAREMSKDWSAAGSAIQAVGSAMSQIENPAAKVMGTIAQAIGSIALGAAQAIAQASNGSAGGPWGWIAFAAAATATMISTIASIHSATGYSEGGVVKAAGGVFVPGNSMSGDMVPAMLNSGELVLNRAQQGNLAAQLDGSGLSGMQLETRLSAEDIIFVLNNNGLRRGFGDFIND
ncbi:MAG: hypothetical protein J1E37_06070 [Prevotella sp.]|nr:hypothetical protein [Prevotella sp.]